MRKLNCPRCNSKSLYRDFDGMTCLTCWHTIFTDESLGHLWREVHAPSVGLPPSVKRKMNETWGK